MRTPGYPLFLTMMPSIRWALAAQAVVGGIVAILVALWIVRSWSVGAALLTEFLVAFDLPSEVLSNQVMAEELFQLLLLLVVVPPLLVISRATKDSRGLTIAALSGLAAAAAILTRPIAIAVPILMPIPFLFVRSIGRRRFTIAAIACALSAIAPCAWILRNYEVAGYLGLSTSAPINLYYYRAVEVEARRTGTNVTSVKYAFGRKLGVPFEHIFDANVQSPQLVSRMNRLSSQVIMHAPLQAVLMTILNTVYISTFPTRTPLADLLGTPGGDIAGSGLSSGNPSLSRFAIEFHKLLQSPVLAMLVAFQAILTVVVWIGIFLAMLRCRHATLEYRVWTIYLMLVSLFMIVLAAGGEADVRFRVPVVPLFAIVAALGYFPVARSPVACES